jgi:HTH-type transcriptional regulator, sugar sensing transcriptional regulator
VEKQQQVIDELQHLAMSGYEARAYVALLGAGRPLNGYEVAKRSGVPRSQIYEALTKLVNREFVFEVKTDDTTDARSTSYVPLPAQSLIGRLRSEFNSSATLLEHELPKLAEPAQARLVVGLNSYSAVYGRVRDLIASARERLWLAVWNIQTDELRQSLDTAERRGIETIAVEYLDDGDAPLIRGSYHETRPVLAVDVGEDHVLFHVTADERATIVGMTDGAGDAWGTYSSDPATVQLAIGYVRQAIALNLVGMQLGADALKNAVAQVRKP